jgi:chromate transporter
MNRTEATLPDLFFSFLRLGITAFGGPAMIAYIRQLAVERKLWLDDETLRSGVALCQTIPGATSMQMSAYVGLKARGVAGAAASFIGFVLPAFAIMVVLGVLYTRVSSLPAVISVFSGLHVLVVAIIANATFFFGKTTLKKWPGFAVAALATTAFLLSLHPIMVIGLSAAVGLVLLTDHTATPRATDDPPRLSTLKPVMLMSLAIVLLLVALFYINRTLFALGALMLRIDLFAFGGGFASVPLMFHEVVSVRSWLPPNVFMDGIALGQVTPGPIVITATFVGYMVKGIVGATIATIGVFAPSFLMVVGIAPYFDRLRASSRFVGALNGILCSFVGLLIAVTVRFILNINWGPAHVVLVILALIALYRKVDILWVVLAGIVYSVVFF